MILVCGGLADSVTELMCARLDDCGYPYRLLDLGQYPAAFQVEWLWKQSGLVGVISGAGWTLDLAEISGAFIRFPGPEGRLPPPDIADDAHAALFAEHDTGLMALLEDLPCPVVNRIGGGMSNNSKVYQALLLSRCGFLTPPTLVTNDPDAARQFHEEHGGDVIYKSLSGVRSIVRRVEPAMLRRLELLRHGPAQFQRFIPGDNVRVHTIGDRLIATRIRSDAVDYRYAGRDGRSVAMEPTELPAGVAESCLWIARELDLLLAGIDLKRTPDGEYYCFEVNPCPGFVYYERHTGQPISTAVAELLHGARSAHHPKNRREPTMA